MAKASTLFDLVIVTLCCAGLSGCGIGLAAPGAGQPSLPAPTPAASATSYTGINNPGYYSLILDDLQSQFSVAPLTYPGPVSGGNFVKSDGIANFGNTAGTQLGLAVEAPGVAAVLRPGDASTYPVVSIAQADCFAIAGRQQYVYLTMSPHAAFSASSPLSLVAAYGTFTASTSTDGKSWVIGDNHGYALPLIGVSSSVPTENGGDPLSYSATCASANGVGTVTSDPAAKFLPFQGIPGSNPTFHFHPNGLFVEDRAPAAPTYFLNTSLYGQIGMAVPNSALDLSTFANSSFRGMVYEFDPNSSARTHPVAFASPKAGPPMLVGGLYPNDDVTQVAGAQYTITLGKQDPVLHGQFTGAQLSVLDTRNVCPVVAQPGAFGSTFKASFDAQGNPVCLASGVALVSLIQGKYVLYFSSFDATNSGASNLTQLIQFYLYQQ